MEKEKKKRKAPSTPFFLVKGISITNQKISVDTTS